MDRARRLQKMDQYIRNNIADEDLVCDIWLGVMPDGADEDTYEEMAEDDEIVQECNSAFILCCILDI